MKIHPLFDAMGGLYILIFTFISFLLKSKFQVRIIMKTNLKERIFGANESIFSFIQFKHSNKILKNNLEKKNWDQNVRLFIWDQSVRDQNVRDQTVRGQTVRDKTVRDSRRLHITHQTR